MLTQNKTQKVLLLGAGGMGINSHLPVIHEHDQFEVVGVIRASEKPIDHPIPVYSPDQLEQALKEHQPDLAIISTPHSYHYQQAKACLEAGCHILIEKPVSFHFEETEELVHLAKEKNRLIVVNLQRRYEGAAHTFRELVAKDKLGKILNVTGIFSHRFSAESEANESWRFNRELAGAGIIEDSAYHIIDLMVYYAGGAIRPGSFHANYQSDEDNPHSFSCVFATQNDVLITAMGTYKIPTNTTQEEITIIGTKGSLFIKRFCKEWNTNPPEVFYKSADGTQKEEFDLSKLPFGRKLPLQAMLDVLGKKNPTKTLYTEGKDVLETHRAISLIKSGLRVQS